MKAISARVKRLEDIKQLTPGKRPYEAVSPDGRVRAQVIVPGHVPSAIIWHDNAMSTDEARAAVDALFPGGWNGFLFPKPCLSVEEWTEKYGETFKTNQ